MSAEIMRESLLQELHKLTQIEITRLSALLADKNKIALDISSKSSKKIATKKTGSSPLRMIIALLLQHPYLVNHVDKEIPTADFPGIKLLTNLVALIKKNPKLSTGTLIEYWRDYPEFELIKKLANYDCGIFATEKELVKGFEDSFKRMEQQLIEHEVEELLEKISLNNCTEEEKRRLHELIFKLNQLKLT